MTKSGHISCACLFGKPGCGERDVNFIEDVSSLRVRFFSPVWPGDSAYI